MCNGYLIRIMFALPLFGTTNLCAQDESPWFVQGQATRYVSDDEIVQQSLTGFELLIQRSLGEGGSGLYAFAYHDDEFAGTYFGLTRAVGSMEFGLGVGAARYDSETWTVINPWGYFSHGKYEGYFHLEYIAEEQSNAEWFYKFQLQRNSDKGWFGGIYGERWIGIGPMLGFFFNQHLSAWVATPMVDTPDEGEMQLIAAFAVQFP